MLWVASSRNSNMALDLKMTEMAYTGTHICDDEY